jgi:hypothetical protein
MNLIFAPECAPFSIAAAMLAGLTGIEIVSMLLGFSISEFIGKPEGGHDGIAGGPLSWLNVGRVPILILVMLVLGTFAAVGFVIQVVAGTIWLPLPATIAAFLAAVAAIPMIRTSSRTVARLVPRDETYVVDATDFIGRMAEVTLGPLDQGLPGRVKVKDVHGNWHQLRASAAEGHDPIGVGATVLLVDQKANIFIAVPAPSDLA